jgi:hypothetical protein
MPKPTRECRSRVVINLYEAKTHLSELVDRAAAGDEITIAKAGCALISCRFPCDRAWCTIPDIERPARNLLVHAVKRTPADFETMDIRLLAGRTFRDSDDHTGPLAVMNSEALAREIAPAGDAIGRRVRVRVPYLASCENAAWCKSDRQSPRRSDAQTHDRRVHEAPWIRPYAPRLRELEAQVRVPQAATLPAARPWDSREPRGAPAAAWR